jgi:exodeoxyribonuclease-3
VTRIATFNVNGVNGRLPVLLKWLGETSYDVVCLQELKTSDDKFPIEAIRDAGYGAIWHGQKSYNGVAILARGRDPIERRRGLPGDPDDTHSRYLEAEIDNMVVACIYLPNGNPAPGPKFDYKLRWFERLVTYSRSLLDERAVLCGDYNVVPTEIDAVVPARWLGDAVFFPESRKAYAKMLSLGWVDAMRRIYQARASTPTGTSPTAAATTEAPDCAWITCLSAHRWTRTFEMPAWMSKPEAGKSRVITHQLGSTLAVRSLVPALLPSTPASRYRRVKEFLIQQIKFSLHGIQLISCYADKLLSRPGGIHQLGRWCECDEKLRKVEVRPAQAMIRLAALSCLSAWSLSLGRHMGASHPLRPSLSVHG